MVVAQELKTKQPLNLVQVANASSRDKPQSIVRNPKTHVTVEKKLELGRLELDERVHEVAGCGKRMLTGWNTGRRGGSFQVRILAQCYTK
jgi:hypothetical protein